MSARAAEAEEIVQQGLAESVAPAAEAAGTVGSSHLRARLSGVREERSRGRARAAA